MVATQVQNSLARLSSPLGTDKLLLRSFHGQEEMSRLFRYEAEVFSSDYNLDFNQLLGQPVVVELDLPKGAKRWFHAIVNHCEQVQSVHGYARYQLTLVPWFWLLTRRQDCRIFQDQSVPDIVKALVGELGFSRQLEGGRLTSTYPPREYCVQYRESTFQFISRLLEEEGICYWFEHQQDNHLLILGDSPGLHKNVAGYAEVPMRPHSATEKLLDSLDTWTVEAAVETGAVMLNDYNFQQHGKSIQGGLRTRSAIPTQHAHGDLEVFDFPGEYDHESVGNTYAKVRIEERHTRRTGSRSEGTARGLTAGCTFQLKDHPRKDQNARYLVVRTELKILAASYAGEADERQGEPSFRIQLETIPADRIFRPARLTPRPTVHGPQTAVVVGPKGQEIYVDDFARVKVQFHWDRYGKRDENSSCWTRVSQPWAGQGYGCMNIPRIGQEVIVDFLEGDPDRPIINGRVYNGDSLPNASNAGRDGKPGNSQPSGIPQAAMMTSFKSNSTPGGGGANEITMNDVAGSEGLFFKAQKDEIHNVGHDREDTVGHDETRTVKNDRKITVDGTHTETIKKDTTIKISVGNLDHDVVAGTSKHHVQGAVTEKYDNKQETTVANEIIIKSTGSKIYVEAATEITLKVGASKLWMDSGGKIELSGTDIAIKGSANVQIKGGNVVSEADASHEIKGALVKSEGSATNTVKGGVVMLNP